MGPLGLYQVTFVSVFCLRHLDYRLGWVGLVVRLGPSVGCFGRLTCGWVSFGTREMGLRWVGKTEKRLLFSLCLWVLCLLYVCQHAGFFLLCFFFPQPKVGMLTRLYASRNRFCFFRSARDEETSSMSASLQRTMSSLEDKEAGLQQALQDTRVAESKLAQVCYVLW